MLLSDPGAHPEMLLEGDSYDGCRILSWDHPKIAQYNIQTPGATKAQAPWPRRGSWASRVSLSLEQ